MRALRRRQIVDVAPPAASSVQHAIDTPHTATDHRFCACVSHHWRSARCARTRRPCHV